MKMNYQLVAALLGLGVAVVGCEKASDPAAPAAVAQKAVVGPDVSAPIVSVNGQVLTQGQLDAQVAFLMRFVRGASPKAKEADLLMSSNRLVASYPQVFVNAMLIKGYAEREHLEIPAETLERYHKLAVRGARHLRAKNYAELQQKLGADAELYDAQVRQEALAEAVKAHVIAANPTNLPPDYAERRLAEIRAYNRQMDATNVLIHARAQAAWERLKAGEPFEEIAQEYTEIDDERSEKGEWGLLDLKILEDYPELLAAVRKLSPGECSPPVEGDNGLLIVRLNAKDEAKGEYELSRIYFQLPMFALEGSAEELVAEARRQHGEAVWAETLKTLEQQAEIRYFGPDGEPMADKQQGGK